MRTRTIREAAAYFRESDPQTCLTETANFLTPKNGLFDFPHLIGFRLGRRLAVSREIGLQRLHRNKVFAPYPGAELLCVTFGPPSCGTAEAALF